MKDRGTKKHEPSAVAVMDGDDILSFDDRNYATVTVPEWGGRQVRVRSMSAFEVLEFVDEQQKPENRQLHTPRLLTRTLCSADGVLLYTPDDPKVIEALRHKNPLALQRLSKAAMELSGMHFVQASDGVKESEVAREEKNGSGGTATSDSPTA